MAKVELPFLKIEKDRSGRQRYPYFRRNGQRWRLPGTWPQNPPSEEFMAEYRRLLAATDSRDSQTNAPTDRRSFPRGSFGRLVSDYLESAKFKTKKPRTKAEYRRVCEALSVEHGEKAVALMEQRHVRRMQDARAETPGAANTVLRMMKILLNFAVRDGLTKANPAAGMEELPVGEIRSWTDEECAAFEKRWAPGTMQRRAYALSLYTGQRLSDVVAMSRTHRNIIDGEPHIRVVQGKTGEELWIPEHPELTTELARGVAGITTLLTTPTQGKPFDPVYFGAWFAEAIDEAGLPVDCKTHGLRKCAARTLADLGCSTEQIKAIIGHRTDRMVGHYVKTADKRKRASAAMRAWKNAK